MSRKKKNRQKKRTKPKFDDVAIPITDNSGTHYEYTHTKDFTTDIMRVLGLFEQTRGIIMEVETLNKFLFYKDDMEDYLIFRDNLINEVSKNHKVKLNDQVDYFELIIKN